MEKHVQADKFCTHSWQRSDSSNRGDILLKIIDKVERLDQWFKCYILINME